MSLLPRRRSNRCNWTLEGSNRPLLLQRGMRPEIWTLQAANINCVETILMVKNIAFCFRSSLFYWVSVGLHCKEAPCNCSPASFHLNIGEETPPQSDPDCNSQSETADPCAEAWMSTWSSQLRLRDCKRKKEILNLQCSHFRARKRQLCVCVGGETLCCCCCCCLRHWNHPRGRFTVDPEGSASGSGGNRPEVKRKQTVFF